jgi:uncharacterized protein YqeY
METEVIDLNTLIMEAMKAHDTVRTETLRGIKTAFMNWQTSKEHAGKELTYVDRVQIIKKMVKQREESIEQYVAAGRQELADAEQAQINVLKEFLPAEITADQIEYVVDNIVLSRVIEPIKKNMGVIIKAVKETLPTADGKLISQIVASKLS